MISRLIRKLQHRLSCIAGWTENMEEKKYKAIIEGILFSMGESVELEKIAGTLGLDQKKTKELIVSVPLFHTKGAHCHHPPWRRILNTVSALRVLFAFLPKPVRSSDIRLPATDLLFLCRFFFET